MFRIIVYSLILSTLCGLGISIGDLTTKSLSSRNKIIKIDWKPISIFPEEAKRFR